MNVKVVVATDSFKESLSAREVAEAIAVGVRRAAPNCQCVTVPVADGGEGTVNAIVDATRGCIKRLTVTGPLGRPVKAAFGITGYGKTAVIEMAAASGLELVPPSKRNPLNTNTFGVGELICAALEKKVSRILVGIGGSATVDGGTGMAQALGVQFGGIREGTLVDGRGVSSITSIDVREINKRFKAMKIEVACDVTNTLVGENGAAAIYGPQKGATPAQVKILDANLSHLADLIERDLGKSVRNLPGAGAAGGLGAGLVAFLGARLRPGVEMVLEAVEFEKQLKGAALVITGEGKLDGQSAFGKTPVGVARAARKHGIPVVALAAVLGEGYEAVYKEGIGACFAIADGPMSKRESMKRTSELLTARAENVMRLFMQRAGR